MSARVPTGTAPAGTRGSDPQVPSRVGEPVRGFRPGGRRRARIAGGVALAAVAIGGNVLAYASLDDRTAVLQVVEDVRAGDVLTVDRLRVVTVDVDPTVPVVLAADLAAVTDQHARVHIPSGSLLSPVVLQPGPLAAAGAAVVGIELRPTRVPDGVRERSRLQLVATDDGGELRTEGRAVTRPAEADGVSGAVTMSVEVAREDAARLAAADEVRVILLDPGIDPVFAPPVPGGDGS